ncbi:diacylglycerol/lipid kinase family protein [Modestobacter lapidis]|nr:diacylglycerol kinase [Modestobacter lapidis]
MQKLLVLLNRDAGTADDVSVEAALDELRRGAEVTVAATADEAELLEAVGGRGDRRLVVLGGDGSVHSAIRALDSAGALGPGEPVGVIPRGTGNDLARTLGLPLDPVAAATVVLAGLPCPVDLLRGDDGGLVVNAVHVGVGARASAEAIRFKGRLGTAAFPLGAVIAGLTTRGVALRVEADGEVVGSEAGGWAADGSTEVLLVGVCNGPTIAGGTSLAPGALIDDGMAEVVVSTATGPVVRGAFAAALLTGAHVDRPDVQIARARHVRIQGGPVDLVADGELQQAVGSRTWRVDPGAWSVLVPR